MRKWPARIVFALQAAAFAMIPAIAGGASAGETSEKYGSGSNSALDAYQNHISPARGSRCGMHPSCSQYAKLAFSRLNPVDAYLATTDRLLRCSQDPGTYPVRYVSGIRSAYDPPPPPEARTAATAAAMTTEESAAIAATAAIAAPQAPLGVDSAGSGVALLMEELGRPDLALREYAGEYSSGATARERELGLRGMAASLRATGDYKGLAHLQRMVSAREPGMTALGSELYRQQAMMLFEADEYEKSLTLLRLSGIKADGPGYPEAQLIRCLALARLERWGELPPAASSFGGHPAYGAAAPGFQALPGRISALPAKSPALAGWMSALVPGSGYAYSGRKGAALAAFVINSLFIWTVYEAVDRKNYAIAATAGVLGSGWYFGGIRGSAASARARNHKVRRAEADAAVQAGVTVWRENDSLRRIP